MARRRNPASGFPPYTAPGASLFSNWHRNRADVMFCLPLYDLALPLPAPLFFQGSREKKVESSAWSLCSGLPLSTAENRRALPECESRFFLPIPYLTGALKHASHALPSPPSSLLPPPYSLLPTFTGALERASHALPSTFPSLLSTFTGAPERASHALPSTFSSLLSTSCIVSTHSSLPSPPYSLPSQARSSAPATHYPLPSPPYSLLSTLSCSTPV